MVEKSDQARRRISLELSEELLAWIDGFKAEWGLRSRGDILERLLEQFAQGDDGDEEDGAEPEPPGSLNETGAIVLINRDLVSSSDLNRVSDEIPKIDIERSGRAGAAAAQAGRSGGGIDLPGFVRRQSVQLKRSLEPPSPGASQTLQGVELIDAAAIAEALGAARDHWFDLYGQAATEAVLEAAMVWMAQEVWIQAEQSEGRPFTWSLLVQVIQGVAPSWPAGAASFERVIVAAGILEDPFSARTLPLRIPTLIRRFVQRLRKRRKHQSFQAIDHTMTVLGALKLLKMPTTPDMAISLVQIREAYRDQAQCHHPDAGGSADVMRRLNEAYQLLKELYRDKP
ncbi:MAG: J domain-containing protein [Cyanobacteria bacterium]|nr:J domain-containing protein [Cyanobacteriota bacterium]